MNHLFMEPPFIRIVGKDYFPLVLHTRQLHRASPARASRIHDMYVINAYYVGCNHIDSSPRDAEVTV